MGKKKKGVSNRLTKMSEEERVRYLQHRAAMEEEAKRRKEELISTYMKRKLKREEAFTRLNIAKINENWHQILRKIKIKELKTEIEDLRLWLTKVIEIKNSIITRLMVEIEESEEQYKHNLHSHLSYIDHFINFHFERQSKLKNDFDEYKDVIELDARTEMKTFWEKTKNEQEYLKMIIYGNQTNYNETMRKIKEFRDSKLEEYTNTLKADLQTMVKTYDVKIEKIWRNINTILREYLVRTSVQRHHYIELKHLDDRNTAERLDNERRIARFTELLEKTKNEYETLHKNREKKIKNLQDLQKVLTKQLQDFKQNLTKDIRKDETKLKLMTYSSNSTIKHLQKILETGKNINNFVVCCKRLESENEQMLTWAKHRGILDRFEEMLEKTDTLVTSESDFSQTNGEISKTSDESEEIAKKSEDIVESTKTSDEIEEIQEEIFDEKIESTKTSDEIESIEKEDESEEKKFHESLDAVEDLPNLFDNLKKMENLWWSYNKVEIDCLELKAEKQQLIAENENMKKIIKRILRDAALEAPTPKDVLIPVKNKIKIRSAPLAANKIDMHGLSFLVIDL